MALPAPALPVSPENAAVTPEPPEPPAVVGLLAEARQAWEGGNPRWAEALARRARCFQPDSVAAATMQCALLRALGRVEQALAIARQFEASGDPELLAELARICCDLERWKDAQRITESLSEAPTSLTSRIQLAQA